MDDLLVIFYSNYLFDYFEKNYLIFLIPLLLYFSYFFLLTL